MDAKELTLIGQVYKAEILGRGLPERKCMMSERALLGS